MSRYLCGFYTCLLAWDISTRSTWCALVDALFLIAFVAIIRGEK